MTSNHKKYESRLREILKCLLEYEIRAKYGKGMFMMLFDREVCIEIGKAQVIIKPFDAQERVMELHQMTARHIAM